MKDKVPLVLILAICSFEIKVQATNATTSSALNQTASVTVPSPTISISSSANSDDSDPTALGETASNSTDSEKNTTDPPTSTPMATTSTFASSTTTNLSATNEVASTPIDSIEIVPSPTGAPSIAHNSTTVPIANSSTPNSNVGTSITNSSTPGQTTLSSPAPIPTSSISRASSLESLNPTVPTLTTTSLTQVPHTTTSRPLTSNPTGTPHSSSLLTTTTTSTTTTTTISASTTTATTTMRTTTTTYLNSTPKQASMVDNVIFLICQLCFQMRKPCPCFGQEEGVRIQPAFIQSGSVPFLQDSFDLARISRCRDAPSEVGGCSNFQVAWSYVGGNKCVQFVYSGCGSSSNLFQSKRLCLRTCGLESSMF